MMSYHNRDDEREGEEVLTRQAWNRYQGRSDDRIDAEERQAILRALREADRRKVEIITEEGS